MVEAATVQVATHYALAWRDTLAGQPDTLPRLGLKFRQEGRFHILYRPTGPLLDPADWMLTAPPGESVSLDQIRAARERFIYAHRREDYSPYDTLAAYRKRSARLPFNATADAIWGIATRDALDAAQEFGPVCAGAELVPLAQTAPLMPRAEDSTVPGFRGADAPANLESILGA
ncbi:hypothetical protein [Acidocella aminolytica]|uniref:hypothetical protein n=1 Tax=Acidocella aminolytica TaxID=33998 RepID=UPI001114B721|nr:hypothetical protein [Acidocella aminolytica]